jgi:hyperosmotically inducible periplasmic protein
MKEHTMTRRSSRLLPVAAAAALALSLAACGEREDERTIGQRIDSTVNQVERNAESMTADARSAADKASTEVIDKVKDAAITTSINAELAKDKDLSALKIDVDTQNARVRLSGTAPDAAARDRATALARAVDGVVAVDNQLVVSPAR